ncbi:hypothetical protein D3C75_1309320 [compost metagenome]
MARLAVTGNLNGDLRLGIQPGFEAMPYGVGEIGNPLPASDVDHTKTKILW